MVTSRSHGDRLGTQSALRRTKATVHNLLTFDRSTFGNCGAALWGIGWHRAPSPNMLPHMTLHFDLIEAESRETRGVMIYAHGILGQGVNWRSIARRVANETGIAGALVDLRHHGESQGFPPPDTVEACARDLGELQFDAPVVAILGHSFGGKVALAYAGQKGPSAGSLKTFVVDSYPGPRPDHRGSEGVLNVLDQLRQVLDFKEIFEHRRDFISVMMDRGITRPTATWLGMNLTPAKLVQEDAGGYRFGVDLDRIDALLSDYFVADLWDSVGAKTALLIGKNSTIVDGKGAERAKKLGAEIAYFNAGHWVHAEVPEALSSYLVGALSDII